MDCFQLAWMNSNKNDYMDNISTFHKGIIPYFLKNNPTLLTLTKIIGDTINLGAQGVSLVTQGTTSGSDQMSRLEDDNSAINKLINSMKDINHIITMDVKAVSSQKIIYLNSMHDCYKNFILDLECPTLSAKTDIEYGDIFNKRFKDIRSSAYGLTVDNIVKGGMNTILAHCRSSMSSDEAREKILKYMSIPSALIIKEAWTNQTDGLRYRCYEKDTIDLSTHPPRTFMETLCDASRP